MKRIGLVIAIVLLGCFLVAPYFAGKSIERGVKNQVELLSSLSGLRASIEKYERGYLKSKVTCRLGMDPSIFRAALDQPPLDEKTLEMMTKLFSLTTILYHGPVLTNRSFGLGIVDFEAVCNEAEFPELKEFLAQNHIDELYKAYGRIGFDGSGWAVQTIPPFKISPQSDSKRVLSFEGMEANIQFEDYGKTYRLDGRIPGLKISRDDLLKLEIADISLAGQGEIKDTGPLSLGDFEIAIESVTGSGPRASFSLKGAKIREKVLGGKDATLNIQQSLGVAKFEMGDTLIEQAELILSCKNISEKLITQYTDLLPKIIEVKADEEKIKTLLADFLEKNLAEALGKSPALCIPKLAFAWNGGKFHANANLRLDKKDLTSPLDWTNEAFWMQRLQVNAHMELSSLIAQNIAAAQVKSQIRQMAATNPELDFTQEQIAQMAEAQAFFILEGLTRQGLLVRSEDGYSAELEIKDGSMILNSQSIPLPSFG